MTITTVYNKDTVRNELILYFAPSGCQFSFSTKVSLDWLDLEIEQTKLYSRDGDGNNLEQIQDDID